MTYGVIKGLNESCACTVLDPAEVAASFSEVSGAELLGNLPDTHPHLFAKTPVYVSHKHLDEMMALVGAIDRIASLPNWLQRDGVEQDHAAMKVHGVFMGYDFHMTADGPRLIEVNTNAGGAFLNLFAAKQFRACCDMLDLSKIVMPEDAERKVADMFVAEWAAAGRSGKPGLIAIVDSAPKDQYLYPEFLLAAKLLREHDFETRVVAPEDLTSRNGDLYVDGKRVDVIYNRLTDFDLSRHDDIRRAWQHGNVVITPDPHTHRRLADKRNLVKLSDREFLRQIGANETDIELVTRLVPKTVLVTSENSEQLWAGRKRWYFKPVAGFGSKAVYRGDKLTRGTWAKMRDQDYVAQELATPSNRVVIAEGKPGLCKFDVRLYIYRDQLLAAAARLYEGQTTNFRTPGGGFAPLATL